MADENTPSKKARFGDKSEPTIVPPEHVESYLKWLAIINKNSSLVGPNSPSDPSPIPGTSTEHIPSPPTHTLRGLLRDYILFDSTDSLTLPKIPCSTPSLPSTNRTSPFDPGAHLDWSRIPVGVLKVTDITKRMRSHLERILLKDFDAEVALPAQQMMGALAFRIMVDPDVKQFSSEGTVDSYASNLCKVTTSFYSDLTGGVVDRSAQVAAKRRIVITDKALKIEEKIRLLWEDKAPYVFDRHLTDLQNSLAESPKEPISFPWTQLSWTGWHAILAKLVWHATDCKGRLVKWAILYGGAQYVVILHIHLKDSQGEARPFVFVSPPEDYNDPTFPITSAALYMLLSSEMAQETLMEELGILHPSTFVVTPIKSTQKKQATTGRPATLEDLRNTEIHKFCVKLGSNVPRIMYRKGISPSPSEYPSPDMPMISLVEIDQEGTTALVYRSEDKKMVFKVFDAEVEDGNGKRTLSDVAENEGKTYTLLSKAPAVRIPVRLGMFTLGTQTVYAMTYEGESPSSLPSLPYPSRESLYTSLVAMHQAGVLHGDLAARNVVMRPEHPPVIIDFSHSQVGHSCLGEALCDELIEARKLLALGDADLSGMEQYRTSSLLERMHTSIASSMLRTTCSCKFIVFGIIAGVLLAMFSFP